MSIYSPGLVLFDYEPPKRPPEPKPPIKRIEQAQIEIPNETRIKALKLETERREPCRARDAWKA